MTSMIRMVLAVLLFAAATATAVTSTNPEILTTYDKSLSTTANISLATKSVPDLSGRDESDADGSILGLELPAVYESDGATIISRCTVPDTVALTYDDGPFMYTDTLLDILEEKGVKATFFILGDSNSRLSDYKEMVQRAHREGHQIASHTWSHKDLSMMDSQQIREEMTELDHAIENLLGVKPVYMRPPFGGLSTTAKKTLASMGYNIVLWNHDTNDWRHPSDVNENLIPIRQAVSSGDTQGHIILMHDVIEKTVTELTLQAIELVRSKGFRMVTVGECLGKPKSAWYRE
ncbi:hypothetical protein BGZ97_001499 [Linnemannia gamsii]|uniref:NodB homology domain-containing protein n=1 Tax=Linnemannia gamsii TaxID=64522 RepID=A0A9P6RJ51_9FUNG|nr:hypothetical protein BGZ97_001499 [Linnemannia gamsii]